MTDIVRRTAIVTGGGTGIGRGCAIALAAKGWRVAVLGRRRAPLVDTVGLLTGDQHLALPTDVTQPNQVDAAFQAISEQCNRVDLLVNNAGISAPAVPFDEINVDDWHKVVAVNLTGSFLCARAAFRHMKSQSPAGGRIINNGSVSAQSPRPNSAPYTATKHAITGLTKSLALDGRAFGITCGQIDIGNAATEMVDAIKVGAPQADGSIRAEPTMLVSDVGRAVAYMASLPADANVLNMTVMASAMPLVGRG